jgi:predicted ATP-dependent endonuclease of OLD family
MKIRALQINNFKSLVDFRLEFADFTCLIGLNGAGKSTVLQALDFVAQLMRGRLDDWLLGRDWKANDLDSKLTQKRNIDFTIDFEASPLVFLRWTGSFNRDHLYCSTESITRSYDGQLDKGERLFHVSDGKYRLGTDSPQAIQFDYQGSLLSQLKDGAITAACEEGSLLNLKQFLYHSRSLDLLSPHLLRQRTRGEAQDLGSGGEKLSAFVHELEPEKKRQLEARLKQAYPQLINITSRSLKGGWKRLDVLEEYEVVKDGEWRMLPFPLATEAKHINDGMLRLMAIIGETLTDHSLLLFDEIENGINPELVEYVVDTLVDSPQQILVTTHSPMILNFLEDDIARKGMQYIYKTADGHTHAIPFFQIPSMQEKLKFMGPGEVYADTDLPALQQEIADESRKS